MKFSSKQNMNYLPSKWNFKSNLIISLASFVAMVILSTNAVAANQTNGKLLNYRCDSACIENGVAPDAPGKELSKALTFSNPHNQPTGPAVTPTPGGGGGNVGGNDEQIIAIDGPSPCAAHNTNQGQYTWVAPSGFHIIAASQDPASEAFIEGITDTTISINGMLRGDGITCSDMKISWTIAKTTASTDGEPTWLPNGYKTGGKIVKKSGATQYARANIVAYPTPNNPELIFSSGTISTYEKHIITNMGISNFDNLTKENWWLFGEDRDLRVKLNYPAGATRPIFLPIEADEVLIGSCTYGLFPLYVGERVMVMPETDANVLADGRAMFLCVNRFDFLVTYGRNLRL